MDYFIHVVSTTINCLFGNINVNNIKRALVETGMSEQFQGVRKSLGFNPHTQASKPVVSHTHTNKR